MKLLGANSGFLAMNATMAARNVDICGGSQGQVRCEVVFTWEVPSLPSRNLTWTLPEGHSKYQKLVIQPLPLWRVKLLVSRSVVIDQAKKVQPR